MKRKIDWDEEEESAQEDSTRSDEDSATEEPRINDVLNNLSQAVSFKKICFRPVAYYVRFQRCLFFLDTLRRITPKSAQNASHKHLGTGRICVTPLQHGCSQASCSQDIS